MKKIISGLFVAVFVGGLSFVTVSEAVKSPNSNHRYDKKIELEQEMDADELKKKEENEIKKNKEESREYLYSRKENHRGNYRGEMRQRHHGEMNNSCW
ncbi:hypothetical protein IGJ02_002396 [Enterococcus sp. DIV0724b]|uniref:hypothetical protein n=1 Tax=Enterococcus sp. DIV0724b TaxID=2774694 RepID=UPI003D2FAA61